MLLLVTACATAPTVTHTGCVGVGEVLAASCYQCHSATTRSRGLDFETDWYTTWVENDLITPGDASTSNVYMRMTNPTRPMPPDGQVSEEYLTIIREWIDAGAVCPDGATKQDSGQDSSLP